MKTTAKVLAYTALIAAVGLAGVVTARAADLHLLNVSYDPTRELYQEVNAAFAKYKDLKEGKNAALRAAEVRRVLDLVHLGDRGAMKVSKL